MADPLQPSPSPSHRPEARQNCWIATSTYKRVRDVAAAEQLTIGALLEEALTYAVLAAAAARIHAREDDHAEPAASH